MRKRVHTLGVVPADVHSCLSVATQSLGVANKASLPAKPLLTALNIHAVGRFLYFSATQIIES